jgi:hypothetical protein
MTGHRLPLAARAANALGALTQRAGIEPFRLSVPALMEAARRETGLRDFGDPGFEAPLHRLLDALETEARPSLTGRVGLRQQLVRNLANRLRIHEALTRHPDIREVPVERPIFILGFPRTGSTLLHRLLAHMPGARVPLFWELLRPAPPPEAARRETDPRIAQAEKAIRGLYFMAPHMPAIHAFGAREPEECLQLLENRFTCASYGFYCRVPAYLQWLSTQDMVPAYRDYRTQLQVLSYRTPGAPWILKWPGHLLNLDALFAVFPDACVVQTHRSLHAVAPSSCSYSATLMRLFSDDVSPAAIGRQWLADSALVLERSLAARARLGEGRFHDVRYADLTGDPLAAVRAVHERFGLPLSDQVEAAVRGRTSEHRADAHRYSLAQFGLRRDEIDARFSDYHQRFGLG